MGCVIKIQVSYKNAFWREDRLSGFTISLDDPCRRGGHSDGGHENLPIGGH